MGNCQAIDAAALVIQHPCGKIERLYWPVTVSEVMRLNPGHYVSLIIPLQASDQEDKQDQKMVRFTRVKLLRPTDTLALGHAYRLVTSQEVMKVLRAKQYAKTKKVKQEIVDVKLQKAEKKQTSGSEKKTERTPHIENNHRATQEERQRTRPAPTNTASLRSKSWQPSLQSISEAAKADISL